MAAYPPPAFLLPTALPGRPLQEVRRAGWGFEPWVCLVPPPPRQSLQWGLGPDPILRGKCFRHHHICAHSGVCVCVRKLCELNGSAGLAQEGLRWYREVWRRLPGPLLLFSSLLSALCCCHKERQVGGKRVSQGSSQWPENNVFLLCWPSDDQPVSVQVP